MAELVVDRLFGHPHPSRELRGPQPVRARVLEEDQMRRLEVVEPVRVQPLQHVLPDDLQGLAQERSDQRRAGRRLRPGRLSKVT